MKTDNSPPPSCYFCGEYTQDEDREDLNVLVCKRCASQPAQPCTVCGTMTHPARITYSMSMEANLCFRCMLERDASVEDAEGAPDFVRVVGFHNSVYDRAASDEAESWAKVEHAARFAKVAHEGQTRKGSSEPYFQHVHRVAQSLRAEGWGSPVVAAGYLHDVVEDTDATIEDIHELFGERVAEYVEILTDPPKSKRFPNRKARKAEVVRKLSQAPYHARAIKLADIEDNLRSVEELDPDFRRVWLLEKITLIAVLRHGHSDDKANKLLDQAVAALKALG
jgi:hypothetical protein